MTEFDIMYGKGISKEGEILVLGEKYEIISKKGATYSYGDEKLAVGYDNTREYLKENKFWASVRRVDDAYGDRNLICNCVSIEEYSS